MKRNSALSEENLAVSVEQVSIPITSDNTVISFFEHSAADIEHPILIRLDFADTILGRSCDVSMLVQVLIDAIIDLAIPAVAACEDAISELELDGLTDPSIGHSKSLCMSFLPFLPKPSCTAPCKVGPYSFNFGFTVLMA